MTAGRVPGPAAGRVLLLGAAMGVAADLLLRAGPVGPGLALWTLGLAVAAGALVRTGAASAWGGVAVAAAAATAWRAAPLLQLLFFGVMVLAAAAVVLEASGRRFGRARVADHLYGVARVPAAAVVGAVPVLAQADPPRLPADRRRAVALGRGLLLAMPPLAIFLALFVGADPVFERTVGRVATFGLDDLPRHAGLVLGFGWVAAGLLGAVVPGRRPNPLSRLRPPRLGIEETAVVLGLVASLFAVFVALQLGYLFGGRAALESITGMTLAEYARRGFFELVAAAGLVLALLLGVGAAAPRRAGRWVFRSLAGVLVVLVLVVIASAALRLGLYVREFGLTVTRLYVAAFMAWLAVTLAWYAVTVVRGRPRPFAAGAHVLAVAAVFGLGVLDPDAVIARTNLGHDGRRPVDARYLATLDADAVPPVLARLDALTPEGRCVVARSLRQRRDHRFRATGWRAWNAGRARARRAIDRAAPVLARIDRTCGDAVAGDPGDTGSPSADVASRSADAATPPPDAASPDPAAGDGFAAGAGGGGG